MKTDLLRKSAYNYNISHNTVNNIVRRSKRNKQGIYPYKSIKAVRITKLQREKRVQ